MTRIPAGHPAGLVVRHSPPHKGDNRLASSLRGLDRAHATALLKNQQTASLLNAVVRGAGPGQIPPAHTHP